MLTFNLTFTINKCLWTNHVFLFRYSIFFTWIKWIELNWIELRSRNLVTKANISFWWRSLSSKVLCDWGCASCVRIVWLYLIGFLVLFSCFELHILWLNRLSTSILFDWTVPVAVHLLNRFSNRIVFGWTVYVN